MTAGQLEVARRHQGWHAERYGHGTSNVTFVEGLIEDLATAGIADASVASHPHAFVLDDHHRFERGRPMRECGNTFDMLAASRNAPHFVVQGNTEVQFGLFDCAERGARALAPAAACC